MVAIEITGYCMKCKEKRVMKETALKPIKRKNGSETPAVSGKCTKCGTNMYKILSGDERDALGIKMPAPAPKKK